MKDLIALLKQNEKPYCKMDEAMQAKADQLSKKCFEWLNANGVWIGLLRDTAFIKNETYRLRADYTPPAEDEYELCEIFKAPCFVFNYDDEDRPIGTAVNHTRFAGYLYEDGQVRAVSVVYNKREGCTLYSLAFDDLKAYYNIWRPTHVVFKRTK